MANYDISAPSGQVRLLVTDTNQTDLIFQDTEISAFLSMAGQNVYRAASIAYGTIIRSRALLAKMVNRDGYASTDQALQEMIQAKKDLENLAMTANGLLTDDFNGNSDELFESFRPGWRDLTENVIE